ncbi:hypothetical protein NLJ89_g9156 [Agrocybe chaxingu]|uniref:Secreted protein n=1 Tax=Agrocybe chaxingu TaxID=84603 RepID=A0A9W8K143_9AGAR|nr:hypothetical protein NLJ89_g9156 [Agrocybe chaxingu]
MQFQRSIHRLLVLTFAAILVANALPTDSTIEEREIAPSGSLPLTSGCLPLPTGAIQPIPTCVLPLPTGDIPVPTELPSL